MKKSILLTLTLFCCSMWVFAQDTTQQPSTSTGSESGASSQTGSQTPSGHADMADSHNGMNGTETTIMGCLSNSGGGYTLTDASGTQYQLQGDTSKLSSNVNKQVEIKGMASASGSSSGSMGSGSTGAQGTGSASTAAAGQMFTVSKVKKTGDSCNTK